MKEPKLISSAIKDISCGDNVVIIEPVNIYGCSLDDNSFIGPFVEIQKDVSIGRRTKIQSHSFVCELVSIGEDCFIGHGVMFINDKFKIGKSAGGEKSLWCSTSIGDRVYIGSNSTILPISICNDVVIGAGSVVTKDIIHSGIYAGNPAKFLKENPNL